MKTEQFYVPSLCRQTFGKEAVKLMPPDPTDRLRFKWAFSKLYIHPSIDFPNYRYYCHNKPYYINFSNILYDKFLKPLCGKVFFRDKFGIGFKSISLIEHMALIHMVLGLVKKADLCQNKLGKMEDWSESDFYRAIRLSNTEYYGERVFGSLGLWFLSIYGKEEESHHDIFRYGEFTSENQNFTITLKQINKIKEYMKQFKPSLKLSSNDLNVIEEFVDETYFV